ncbi:SURF1 family domain-containing protein [Trichoderma austrokoningii]
MRRSPQAQNAMNCAPLLLRNSLRANSRAALAKRAPPQPQCLRPRPAPSVCRRHMSSTAHRSKTPSADDPNFVSIVDLQPQTVRAGKRHGAGIILLALIPITAFILGTWQVQRLGWKTRLIARCEDRLVRDPLPLPPHIDPAVISDFDFRRVLATGTLCHDREMLVGPRMRNGEDGYMVITPLERKDGSTILVNRGWISKKHRSQRTRPDSLVTGEVTIEGLLREPWKKNRFTPENRPDRGEFYFPDVHQMAALTGSQPVWVEATMEPEFLRMMDYEARGIPFGRPAEVTLRNNHAQYIFTWYGLSFATSIMLYMVLKKPPSNVARRVRVGGHM